MKKLMVLALAVLVVGLMAGSAMAQPTFGDSFTIKAEAVECAAATSGYDFTVMITLTNNSGDDLSNIKVQGGTAAWVTVVDPGVFSQVVNPQGKALPAKNANATKNKNKILGATGIGLTDGSDVTYTIIVNGMPDMEDCPNVLGSWSASGQNTEGEDVEAIAVDADNIVLFEADLVTPLTETPEVSACDEAFTCLLDG